jgi:hypothetical protein
MNFKTAVEKERSTKYLMARMEAIDSLLNSKFCRILEYSRENNCKKYDHPIPKASVR